MMSLINGVTFVGLFLLSYSVAMVRAAADTPIGETSGKGGGGSKLGGGELEILRITPRNIHERYAMDLIRQEHFHIPPEKVMEMVQQSGNTVIVAPDPNEGASKIIGHPNLFLMTPQRYTVMQEDGLVPPTLTVVVLKDTVTVSYRDKSMSKWKIPKEELINFCNTWNEYIKVGTCYVDIKGKTVLHYDIQSVESPQESTDHMVDSFNRVLLDKGLHEFQIALQRFTKKLLNDLVVSKTGPNAPVVSDKLKKSLEDLKIQTDEYAGSGSEGEEAENMASGSAPADAGAGDEL